MKSFKIDNDNIAQSAESTKHKKDAICKELKKIKSKYYGTRK